MLASNDMQVPSANPDGTTPANVLQECLDLCATYQPKPQEPVRTIHHLACTGGTLITKCLSAMPNTQVLSEVDPLSPIPTGSGKPSFAPSDMITLVKQSNKEIDQNLIIDLFINNLKIVHKNAVENGQRLILRDHTHSHFHTGSSIPDRQCLRSIISHDFPVLPVITVRHPLDSYLSLKRNNWLHFSPATIEEYCKRYMAFLDAYEGVPLLKYEDFTREPKAVMRKFCEILELPYTDEFVDAFGVFRVTGDSGRKGEVIESRDRKPLESGLLREVSESHSYLSLVERLEYRDES